MFAGDQLLIMTKERILPCLLTTVGLLCFSMEVHAYTKDLYLRLESLGKKSLDLDYVYRDRQNNKRLIRYRLFLPKPIDGSSKYLLILWLHGFGDHGVEDLSQLVHMDETIYPEGQMQDYQFFVCAPQSANGNWLTKVDGTNDDADHSAGIPDRDMLDVTAAIMEDLQKQYPIDERRITLVGISDDGTACWNLLSRQPQRFAAAVPLAAGGALRVPIETMIHTPIWAFHAAGDPSTPVEGVANTINSIKAAGGKAYLTLTEDNRHEVFRRT